MRVYTYFLKNVRLFRLVSMLILAVLLFLMPIIVRAAAI